MVIGQSCQAAAQLCNSFIQDCKDFFWHQFDHLGAILDIRWLSYGLLSCEIWFRKPQLKPLISAGFDIVLLHQLAFFVARYTDVAARHGISWVILGITFEFVDAGQLL